MNVKITEGLDGIIAGESAISTVGQGLELTYRGYRIHDLAASVSFEEVAYLLIYGHLPNAHTLKTYQEKLITLRLIPAALKTLLEQIPGHAHPMDVLRTSCSFLGTLYPEQDPSQAYDIADQLLALFPGILCYWFHYHQQGQRISGLSEALSTGEHFLTLLQQHSPTTLEINMMNVSLILYAEHEFNASTFAARITTSTQSDFYAAITTAIGTLKGPLHGGANEAAMRLISSFSSVEHADHEIHQMLQNKQKIMGFGHRVYRHGDPRSDLIKVWSEKLSHHHPLLFKISERIEHIMQQEKKLYPNVDFYSASAYHYAGIPTSLFTPLFVMARITGWSAHIIEQRNHPRLIRPASIYTGPAIREVPSLHTRS